jgi:Domain of unknown function (DUF4381)
MSGDPGDLANLHDLAVPPLPPFWPPAPGPIICCAALVAFLFIFVIRALARYRANAYRRAATTEIRRLGASDDVADLAAKISEVLKRVALVSFPRSAVASLTGPAWGEFVERSMARKVDVHLLGNVVGRACEPDAPLSRSERDQFVLQAQRWAAQHKRGDA